MNASTVPVEKMINLNFILPGILTKNVDWVNISLPERVGVAQPVYDALREELSSLLGIHAITKAGAFLETNAYTNQATVAIDSRFTGEYDDPAIYVQGQLRKCHEKLLVGQAHLSAGKYTFFQSAQTNEWMSLGHFITHTYEISKHLTHSLYATPLQRITRSCIQKAALKHIAHVPYVHAQFEEIFSRPVESMFDFE